MLIESWESFKKYKFLEEKKMKGNKRQAGRRRKGADSKKLLIKTEVKSKWWWEKFKFNKHKNYWGVVDGRLLVKENSMRLGGGCKSYPTITPV